VITTSSAQNDSVDPVRNPNAPALSASPVAVSTTWPLIEVVIVSPLASMRTANAVSAGIATLSGTSASTLYAPLTTTCRRSTPGVPATSCHM
jgi:hypothetical protein